VTLLLAALAYLAGSIPTGLLLTRRIGVDPRRAGSGNIGATNVLRTAGARLGAATLLGDVAKGAIPTLLAIVLGAGERAASTIGLAAFLGHLFPPWLRFRGGKGVATALGVALVLDPWAACAGVAAFAAVIATSGFVSLASILGATACAVALWAREHPGWPAVVAMALLILARHHANLRRLAAGTEPRVRLLFRQRP
jgi:glycerol-3-phosphate acyltransferase PlsY